jgi:MFS family permease
MIGIGLTLMIQRLYGNYALAGGVSAVLTVANAIGAPLMGRLIDRYGQSFVGRPLIGAFTLSVTGLAALSLAHAPGWALCLVAVAAGASSFPTGSLSRSRWSHLLDRPADVQTAFSIEAVFDDAAFVFGPSLATLLATSVNPIAGVAAAALFLLVGGLGFLAQRDTEPPVRGAGSSPAKRRAGGGEEELKSAAASWSEGPELTGGEKPKQIPPPSSREAAKNGSAIAVPGVAAVCGVFVTMGLVFGANNITMVAVCESWGAQWAAGPILAGGSLASMTGALLYGARRWLSPLWKRFVACLLLQAGASSLFLTAGSFPILIIVNTCAGIAISPSFINGNALIERIVPARKLTEGLTWIGTALGAGMAAGSALAGQLIDRWSPRAGYVVVAAAAIAGIAVALLSAQTLRRQSEPDTAEGAQRP